MADGKSYDWRGGLGLMGLILGAVAAHLARPWPYSALKTVEGEFSPQTREMLFHFGLLAAAGVVLGVLLGHFLNQARVKKASGDGRTA